jgi:extradiol dioxygenase family protein
MTFAAYTGIDVQYNVQQNPVLTWKDWSYVVFGQDYRDTVQSAHQILTQVIFPEWQAKIDKPLADNSAIAAILRGRVQQLAPEMELVNGLVAAVQHNKDRSLERRGWTDLISLRFWGNLIAFVVHALAIKIWDLTETGRFYREISQAYQNMAAQVVTGQKIGEVVGQAGQFALSVALEARPTPFEIFPRLVFKIQLGQRRPDLEFKVHRLWTSEDRYFSETQLCQEKFPYPGPAQALEVFFSEAFLDADSQFAQMGIGVELMIKEGVEQLNLRTPANREADFSCFGFERLGVSDDKKWEFWTIDRQTVNAKEFQFNLTLDPMTWREYIPMIESMPEMQGRMTFFPNGYLVPFQE